MSKQQLERWGETREKGRRHFIWVSGVLGWGLAVGVLWCILMSLLLRHSFIAYVLVAILLFPIAGYLWGCWIWKISEKHYLQSKKPETPPSRRPGWNQGNSTDSG